MKMLRLSTKAPAQVFDARPCVGEKRALRPGYHSVKWRKEESVTESYHAVCDP